MTRARSPVTTKKRHKKILKLAKGYVGRAKNCYRIAIEKVEKALAYSYRDRRQRKRQLRATWILRINAAAREHGLIYSRLIQGIKKLGMEIDRKILAELAVNNPESFKAIAESVKKAEN